MDEPESIAGMLATDEITRHFSSWGLSGALLPSEDSLRYLRASIDRAHLVAEVPEAVRSNFARVRKTFLYGLVEYDLFTVADDDARLVLEGALRARFITYYEGQITVIRDEKEKTLRGSSFDDLHKRVKRHDVLITRDGQHHELSLGMRGLLSWARRERLLVGQRSARGDEVSTRLRNYAAHLSDFHLLAPPDASRTLCRVAEFINKLWGADTPGGQVFPAPAERVPRVTAMAADGTRCVTFPSPRAVRETDSALQDATFAVYLAAPEEELFDFDKGRLSFRHRPGYQCTSLPCELLWGPGPLAELLPDLAHYEDGALNDRVRHLDRLFIIRVDGERNDLPRAPADFFGSEEMEGEWDVIRADYPNDALRHVREHRAKPPSHLNDGRCPDCPITEEGRSPDRVTATACIQRLVAQ